MKFKQLLLATKIFEHQTQKVEQTKQDWIALHKTVNKADKKPQEQSHLKTQDT